MAKYLVTFNYTPEAISGLRKEGAASRRDTIKQLTEALGGKLESFYFAWGETDGYVICDFPDAAAAGALSLAVNEARAVRVSTTVLITPEEMDQFLQRSVDYRPPGA
jgi:uncharacterized protein with GYD domain